MQRMEARRVASLAVDPRLGKRAAEPRVEKAVQGSEGIEVEEAEEAAGMEMRILPTHLRPAAQEILPCGRGREKERGNENVFFWGKGERKRTNQKKIQTPQSLGRRL